MSLVGRVIIAGTMELLIATLCDSAVESQGKLNVIGAFDTLMARSFPAGFSFSLALRFRFSADDHGDHTFSIRLLEDGAEEQAADGERKESTLTVAMPPGTPGFSTKNLIQPLQGQVRKAGVYDFHLYYDGKVLARVPLRVISDAELTPAPRGPELVADAAD